MLFGAERVKKIDNTHVIFYPHNTLSEAGKLKAIAFAEYAASHIQIRSSGKISDVSIQRLLSCVNKDPYAIPALKLILTKCLKDRNYQKIVDDLLPVAKKYPRALRLNLIVTDALLELGKKNEAMLLLEKSLAETDYKTDANTDIRLLSEAIIKLSSIYINLKKIDKGEALWDNVLANEIVAEEFLIRMAAISFYAEFADQGPDGFFAGWSKRRYRRKMEENLLVIEKFLETKHIKNALLLIPLLKIYKRYSMPDRAEKILLSMLLNNPYNSSAMLMLAQFYSTFQRHADAFRAWQVIIDSGRYKNAGRYWKYLTRGKGGEGDFYLELALVALKGGNLKEAVRAFDWFLLLHPDDPEALFKLGITYMRMQNFHKAILRFERVKVFPEADFFRARCYINENRPEKALEALMDAEKTAVKNNRKSFLDENFYTEYAFIADKAGNTEKAEEILKKLLKDAPNDPMLNNFLGYLWSERGDNLDQAEKMINKALAKDSENSAYIDTLAWVLFKKKKFKDALYYIEKALNLEGEIPDAVIAEHAGDIYYALNDINNALKYWQMALEIYSEIIDRKSIVYKINRAKNSKSDQL